MSIRFVFVLLGTLALAACASQVRVSLDYDPTANFSGMRTFAWVESSKSVTGDPLVESDSLLRQRIENAIERELLAKGYRKVSTADAKPDFGVAYHATTRRRMQVVPYQMQFGYGGWWRPYYWGGAYGYDYYAREYTESTLALDLIDPATHKLIWRAVARGYVDEDATPQERNTEVWMTVRKMLQGFPPGSL